MSELADLIVEAMETRLVDLHTALPGRVRSYDAATQTADVEPMLRRALRDTAGEKVLETLPVIPSVPVVFPRAGGFFVSFPVTEGDSVLLIFPERAIDRWRSMGENCDPGDQRLHPLTGAVAIPGLFPRADALADADPDNMRLGQDGGPQIQITPTRVQLGAAATKKVARNGDPVTVTIPAGTFLIAAEAGVLNPTPVNVDGTITDGSNLVRAED